MGQKNTQCTEDGTLDIYKILNATRSEKEVQQSPNRSST
jgi:hypothetical protein